MEDDAVPEVLDDDAREGRRAAYGDPLAVRLRYVVPPDMHLRTPVEILTHRIRRLGEERAIRVVQGGDFRLVTPEGSRLLGLEEQIPKGSEVDIWRFPPDAPEDLLVAPTILYEDNGLLVVDKPGDLTVHPSARYLHNTLTGWLRRRGTPANPAHRTDRETSGVLVCATDGVVERSWKRAFAEARITKSYLAIVDGVVERARRIDLPLGLQGDRGLVRIRMVVDDEGAASVTDLEPVRTDGQRSLVRLFPRTGRQHQIRAHLAAIGSPIVGDKIYHLGDEWFDAYTRRALTAAQAAMLPVPRQLLHAERLEATVDDVAWSFAAPLPAVFVAAMPSLADWEPVAPPWTSTPTSTSTSASTSASTSTPTSTPTSFSD